MEMEPTLKPEQFIRQLITLETIQLEHWQTQSGPNSLKSIWTGDLGHWLWNIKENKVEFSPLKAGAIGYDPEELPETVPYQFFTDKIHPEDIDFVMQRMGELLSGVTEIWQVKYRIQSKDGTWRIYHDRGRIASFDEYGKPLYLYGTTMEITQEESEKIKLQKRTDRLIKKTRQEPVTGFMTRSALLLKLANAFEKAHKTSEPLSLILLKIDRFDEMKERYGLSFAEELLTESSRTLKEVLQGKEKVGLYNESTFLIILENQKKSQGIALAERYADKFEMLSFSEPIDVKISGGITQLREDERISEMIHRLSLKTAKAQNFPESHFCY